MLSQLLLASSVALNAIICVVIISGLAVFLHDLPGLQTFAALHNLVFSLASCALAMEANKKMVAYLTIAVPVLGLGCLCEMTYDCPAIHLVLKPLGAATIVLGTTTMRKMGHRLNQHNNVKRRVNVTPIQLLLCAAALLMATLVFKFPRLVWAQLLELAVITSLAFNLWYHFVAYRNHVNATFAEHLKPSASVKVLTLKEGSGNDAARSQREILNVNKELSGAKRKLQSNMAVGVLLSLNVMLLFYFLLSPFWQQQDEKDHLSMCECVFRGGDESRISNVDWARFTVMIVGFLAGHVAWWHTFFIFKASNRRRAKAVAHATSSNGKKPNRIPGQLTGAQAGVAVSVSLVERSSIQGDGLE